MNLQSPIFDVIRIPSRATVGRLASEVSIEHGIDPEALRGARKKYASSASLEARSDFLFRARARGFAYSNIGNWFGHRDGTTVREWCLDLGME